MKKKKSEIARRRRDPMRAWMTAQMARVKGALSAVKWMAVGAALMWFFMVWKS